MIRMNNARGMGALGAALPPCLTSMPNDYGLEEAYFKASGRFGPGTDGQTWARVETAAIDNHITFSCSYQGTQMSDANKYQMALLMLVNERYERRGLEEEVADCEGETGFLDAEKDEFQAALAACQNAAASGGCPPLKKPQQQGGSKWSANLGWVAGGAIAGAALTFFMAKR
jgi:hypothetical protein